MARTSVGEKRSAKPARIKIMKHKGFTLIEMSLALSLMGILLLIGTEVWSIMGQLHGLYAANQEKGYEVLKLRHALEYDLFKYPNWQQKAQTIFSQNGSGDTLVRYDFQQELVVRQEQGFSDTFRFSLYVQPFGSEAVVSVLDSNAAVWFRQETWSLAHAVP